LNKGPVVSLVEKNNGPGYKTSKYSNLDHNFWTRNPSRSSKVSKDSDCSLESNKNSTKILPSNGWCPGPGEVGQDCQKVLRLSRHSQITTPSTKKNFSSANIKTCRVFWHFDQVRNANRSKDVPTQSNVRPNCIFANCLN